MSEPQRQDLVRKIIHVDMDMFYAAVELRDRPDLRGKPLVVGGSPASRSVVTTATYEARRYGIHSGMSCAEARRLCPSCIFIRPNFAKYARTAERIRAIFHEFTGLVEPVSLDEAYLDVTENKIGERSATRIAKAIKERIRAETGLSASAGVGPSMFIAKLASEHRKPDGLCTVPPERVLEFIRPLPVIKLPGIGKKTDAVLAGLGIRTVADLAAQPRAALEERFGKYGLYLHDLAHGRDDRAVTPDWERRSCGAEETFATDVLDEADIRRRLRPLAERAFSDLAGEGKQARTVTLKIKYFDFRLITRRQTGERFFVSAEEVWSAACGLLERTEAGRVRVRLAGVSLSSFAPPRSRAPTPGSSMPAAPLFQKNTLTKQD